VTEPLPLPVAPALIVIQLALLVAVQPQPVGAVTATVPLPAAAVRFVDVGEIAGVHGVPAWLTVKLSPAIVRVPVRLVVAALAATVNVVLPGPVPAAPELTVIHAALLTADHTQPVPTLTVLLPVPPPATTDCEVGEILGVQGAVNANVFERALAVLPPGPTAETMVS
jgi:hypothetical protein